MASYPSWSWLFLNSHHLYIRNSVENTPRQGMPSIVGSWDFEPCQYVKIRVEIKNWESINISIRKLYQRILSISFSSIAFNVIPLQENIWQVLPYIGIHRIDFILVYSISIINHCCWLFTTSICAVCVFLSNATWSRFII